MNTRIIRHLNSTKDIETTCNEIVSAHNQAVKYGLVELPLLDYVESEVEDDIFFVYIVPSSGLVGLDDLYKLKGVWGADEINVCITANPSICLTFKKK